MKWNINCDTERESYFSDGSSSSTMKLLMERIHIHTQVNETSASRSPMVYSPATADACGGTMSLRLGALEEPLITAVLKRLFAEPVSFLLTL